MFINDAVAAVSRDLTPEGFLRVRARIGRAGLQSYGAGELGFPAGFPADGTLRVWRPPEEVFAPDSMASFAGKPVTADHPPTMVDARNWKLYAVGHCGASIQRDDDHLVTDLLIADAAAAARALEGAELSNGYHADFVFEPGTTPEGEPYDAVQRNIRGNHVALVVAGRCGATCRVGDGPPVDPCGCGGTDRQAAPLDVRDLASAQADDRFVVDAAQLDALVDERVRIIEGARRMVGGGFDPRGRSTPEICRLVVEQTMGRAAMEGREDAYVAAAFDALLATHVPANPLVRHVTGRARGPADRTGALAARNHHLAHAWKGGVTEGA